MSSRNAKLEFSFEKNSFYLEKIKILMEDKGGYILLKGNDSRVKEELTEVIYPYSFTPDAFSEVLDWMASGKHSIVAFMHPHQEVAYILYQSSFNPSSGKFHMTYAPTSKAYLMMDYWNRVESLTKEQLRVLEDFCGKEKSFRILFI